MLPSSLFSTYQQYKEDTDSTKGRGRLKEKARRDAKEHKTYIPTPHTIQNTKSDATHYVFVGILEKARDVLRPRMPAGTKSFYSFKDLGNRFSGLKIYEPSPELLDFTDIKRPKNAQGDDTIYEAEPKTSLEDALSNYQDGYFDLANAAVSTNTGINLAPNLTDQILPIIKDHGSACTILEKFSFVCARRDGLSEDDIVAWGPAVENEDIMRLQTKPTQCQSIAWKGPAKFKEDQIFLSEFFTEAVTLARLAPNYPVEDEFIRGIRELDMTGNIPFHLVYATQILSDVHHIIRDHISSALDSLLKHTTTMDTKMCTFGIAITNAWGSITYSAHLYDALQNEGLLNEHWTDMDAI
ncbi:hypothetical protein IWW34DRAFT_822834 [Fusarium oxysporum f. sp. albedinis]|nr:hypothetical protein IWW34DRAFT_822834 [Fusarium oxysporum f. sp. albedinis]